VFHVPLLPTSISTRRALALKGLIQKTSGLMEGHRVPPLVGYKQK
jgi:hypothetical protein